MGREIDLIRLLADGEYRSGEAIAARLGITRAAVWKALGRLRERWGLPVDSARGRGYRLSVPFEPLDSQAILSELGLQTQIAIARLEVHAEIDSTNARLMAEARAGAPSGTVCLAERQSAGRGRRGRSWVSPIGTNLYLSVLWRYPLAPASLGGASLALGAVVAQVLEGVGIRNLALKWPNDLMWQRHKLGGLLLEVTGEAQGPSCLVAGLGLNMRMTPEQGAAIDRPWTDLWAALGGTLPGRNFLVARLIAAIGGALTLYGERGLAPFLPVWGRFDRLGGESVRLHLGQSTVEGLYAGVTPEGALRLLTKTGIETFQAGEVSLRAPDEPAPIPEGGGLSE